MRNKEKISSETQLTPCTPAFSKILYENKLNRASNKPISWDVHYIKAKHTLNKSWKLLSLLR